MELSAADFRVADLRDTNLDRCSARFARFDGVDLSEATLRDADLRGINLTTATLNGADLTGARLTRMAVLDMQTGGVSRLWPADLSGSRC